ncbi:acyl-CoA dehydrogenase [Planomonospora parontospora subsp. parontospora]|uniref:Acyl-CoA dehydrogenase n=2 Tax=Planomonospora parontospora TaxID=58119 RepID=A0AA37BJ27_9ACTN|nr:acyl-CoA dehydrogenase family protein [Planomonospora parontospora]GGK76285.1 acyl-CoA dehydrogenase [Planomonospora parontospora]GII10153.1 acyl-CoA dehydrogenase [Planomonospora parontospora subsp. parontospora]
MSDDHMTSLNEAIETTVAPQAAETDRAGAFPRSSIDALAKGGLLGLISAAEMGGRGEGLPAAARVIERLSGACGSTAMVVLMHYAATALIEAHGDERVRREIARDEHLTTLAFSEAGSRSHFWAPLGTATADGDRVRLDARKSWITAAGEADSYVWSSRPLEAEGPMSIWFVSSRSPGLDISGSFDGFGLRGNASKPVTGRSVTVDRSALLGGDGAGLEIALQTALPYFLVLNASFSLGLMEALVAKAHDHLLHSRLDHLGQSLADQPLQRARFAELSIRTDMVRAFIDDTLAALGSGREDATLRVLQVKAVAAEAAAEVADGVMRLCGGSAFRKETGVERLFRDALAARVMAPTTEALHDFVGRATLGMPLF